MKAFTAEDARDAEGYLGNYEDAIQAAQPDKHSLIAEFTFASSASSAVRKHKRK